MAKSGNGKTTVNESVWSTVFRDRDINSEVEIPDKVKAIHKNGVSDWVGKKPEDTKPILYVSSVAGESGWQDSEFDKFTGIIHKCYSYAYAGESSPMYVKKHKIFLNKAFKRGNKIFMDSGAHSIHRMLRSGKTLALRNNVAKEQRKQFVEYVTEEWAIRYAEYIRWCYATNKLF